MENNWQRNLYILWIGVFIAGASFSLVSPFLPLLLNEVGQESNVEFWSGMLFSASFLASSLMSPIWGSLADRYGKKPMIIRSGIGIASTYILMFFATQPWHLLAARFLNGVLSGFIPSAISLVASNTPDHRIGRSLGILSTGSSAGSVIGPMLGGLMAAQFGMRMTLLISGGILLSATLVVIFGVHEKVVRSESKRPSLLQDFQEAGRNKRLMSMLLVQTLIALSLMIIQPILTLYIKAMGVGDNLVAYTGVIFSLAGVATVIAAPIWGRIGERIGFQKTLLISLIGISIMNFFQMFAQNVIWFGVMRFSYGLFIAGVAPAANAIIAASVPQTFRGRAFGISNSFNNIGNALGPIIGGAIGTWLGMKYVFVFASLAVALTAVWLRTVTKREKLAV